MNLIFELMGILVISDDIKLSTITISLMLKFKRRYLVKLEPTKPAPPVIKIFELFIF